MTRSQYRRHLKAMMTKLRKWWRGRQDHAERKGVVIFIHGGNTSPRKALNSSVKLYRKILEDGYYPIFICWDSNLRRAYTEQLLRIRSGLYGRRTYIDSSYFLLADIVGSAMRWIPTCDFLIQTLKRSSRWTKCATEVDPGRFQGPTITQGTWKPGLSWRRGAQIAVGAGIQAMVVLPWIGIYVPRAWENLLRRTRAMFRAPSEFDAALAHGHPMPDESKYSPCEGAMARFLDELAETTLADNIPVTLIAHSMGAMIANDVLEYKTGLPYESLVYMAPACSVRDFAQAVGPVLRGRKTNAYVLTLHPKVEAGGEWHGWIAGSVLEWLEGTLTPPNAYMDRALGKWDNALRTCHVYDQNIRQQIHIKSFSYDGRARKKPFEHDHFHHADVRFWDPAFWV